MNDIPARHCTVYGCMIKVPPTRVYCRYHWSLVPWDIKDWLMRIYVLGQAGTDKPWGGKELPHPEWFGALREATQAVERIIRESRPTLHG